MQVQTLEEALVEGSNPIHEALVKKGMKLLEVVDESALNDPLLLGNVPDSVEVEVVKYGNSQPNEVALYAMVR